jgi:hypothetical protein
MLKNQKGAIQVIVILALVIVAVAAVGLWQYERAEKFKAENIKLTAENTTLKETKKTQADTDAERIKTCEASEAELLIRLGQCSEPIVFNGCPTITKVTDKNDPVVKEVEAIGWEVR